MRYRPLFDRPHGLARHAIKHEGKPLFGHLHNRFDGFSVDSDVGQDWSGGQIIIPQIVMDQLEMPDTFTGFCLQAHQTVAEEIVAEPVPAIHVACRRRQRQVDITEFFIGTEIGPGVNSAGIFPRPVFPSLNAELALSRNGSKRPPELPGFDVITAYVAASSFLDVRIIGNRRTDDSDVLDDERRRRKVERLRLRTKSGPKIDFAGFSKTANQFAGLQINSVQVRRANRQYPFVGSVAPIRNPTRGRTGERLRTEVCRLLHPKRPAGGRIECLDQTDAVGSVQHAIDHQRCRSEQVGELQLVMLFA